MVIQSCADYGTRAFESGYCQLQMNIDYEVLYRNPSQSLWPFAFEARLVNSSSIHWRNNLACPSKTTLSQFLFTMDVGPVIDVIWWAGRSRESTIRTIILSEFSYAFVFMLLLFAF